MITRNAAASATISYMYVYPNSVYNKLHLLPHNSLATLFRLFSLSFCHFHSVILASVLFLSFFDSPLRYGFSYHCLSFFLLFWFISGYMSIYKTGMWGHLRCTSPESLKPNNFLFISKISLSQLQEEISSLVIWSPKLRNSGSILAKKTKKNTKEFCIQLCFLDVDSVKMFT